MCRRAGHAALSFGLRSDTPASTANWDHHRQGATREPITLLSEITSPANLRYLFDGTASRVSWLNNGTSEWTNIVTNGAADSRWQIAALRDKVVLTNNVEEPRIHTLGSGTSAVIPELQGVGVTKAKVVLNYNNVILLMNVVADGERVANRIWWSDFRDATKWTTGDPSVSGFQDLDDGESILAAVELGGIVWVFTDKSIWRLFVNVTAESIFGVQRWYSDPVNRTACLKYENTLVSTGKDLFWAGTNSIYTCNQFSTGPSAPDWILKGSGRMFEGPDSIDTAFCESPVAVFSPDATGVSKEVHFYFPKTGSENGINDSGFILSFNNDSVQTAYATSDYTDIGFTALCTFSHATGSGLDCATRPTLIGASGIDYSLKRIGGVFYREYVALIGGDPASDIPDVNYALSQTGYFSELVLPMPFGWPQRDKILRSIILEHETADARTAAPNLIQCFVGNSYHLADPVGETCSVQFHDMGPREMLCPDIDSDEKLVADGTRRDDATSWENLAEQARFLYLRLKITANDGSAPVGSDTAWSAVFFDFLVLP